MQNLNNVDDDIFFQCSTYLIYFAGEITYIPQVFIYIIHDLNAYFTDGIVKMYYKSQKYLIYYFHKLIKESVLSIN